MAERSRPASRRRDPRAERSAGHTGEPVPLAMPGPRTPRERALALTVAASFLVAASSLGMGRSPQPPRAPDCPPARPGDLGYDPDGCWERQRDGTRSFRTTSTSGVRFYHPTPPPQSRYWERPGSSRWSFFSSSRSGSSYRGSGSIGG